jgi:hypothetical protein
MLSSRRAGALPASRPPRSGTSLASRLPTPPRPSQVSHSSTQLRHRRPLTTTVDALPLLRSRRRTSLLPPRPTSRASPSLSSLQSTRTSLLWFLRPLCKRLCFYTALFYSDRARGAQIQPLNPRPKATQTPHMRTYTLTTTSDDDSHAWSLTIITDGSDWTYRALVHHLLLKAGPLPTLALNFPFLFPSSSPPYGGFTV